MNCFEKIIIVTNVNEIRLDGFWEYNGIQPLHLHVMEYGKAYLDDLEYLSQDHDLYQIKDYLLVLVHMKLFRWNVHVDCKYKTIADILKLYPMYHLYHITLSLALYVRKSVLNPELCMKNISIYKSFDEELFEKHVTTLERVQILKNCNKYTHTC